MNKSYSIFKKGSKTYFYSSLFFPKNARDDISDLYAFVRHTDNLVDSRPQKGADFIKFKNSLYQALEGKKVNNLIIKKLILLIEKYNIEDNLIKSFTKSMEKDLTKRNYKNMDELLDYIYGSAEVVGVLMAKILKLDKKSYRYARLLGRAMQYANFIRDIKEDLDLGRQYIPSTELKKYNLKSLDYHEVINNKKGFIKCIRKQIEYFNNWVNNSTKGFKYIPKKYLIPIKTATDMYIWTLNVIKNEPFIVYKKKIKPSVARILITGLRNFAFNNYV